MALDLCTTGALLVLAAWLLWKYLSWNYSYWQQLGVPCLEPWVPFGSDMEAVLARKTAGEVIKEFYCQMEGQPFCGLYSFRQPVLLVRDAHLVRTVLVRDFPAFHDNNFDLNEDLDPIFSRNPFILKGEKWRKLRSQLSPSFTASRLKPMFQLMKEVCNDLVDVLQKEVPSANADGVEASNLCMRYTTDVVSSCALGIKGGALENQDSEMLQTIRLVLEPTTGTIIRLILITAFPRLAALLRIRLVPEKAEKFLRSVVSQTVARREHEGAYRNDYLQMLVELKTKGCLDSSGQVPAEESFFTDVDITAQVTTFLTDGIQTSAAAMSFALYELALNPDVQERLRRELQEAVDKHGGQLSYELIQEATYLDMVISESLRLHPPVPVLEKRCTLPFQMQAPSGRAFTLQPGTPVDIPIMALHLDPRYFPEPDVFDPERFSPENKDRSSMQAYMPFGVGPRTCIGQRFALSQVKMGVAAVILNLEVQQTHRTPVPIKLNPKSIITASKDGLWLAFKPLVR